MLRRLKIPQKQNIFRRHLERLHSSNPIVIQILEDWPFLLKLASKEEIVKKKAISKVWELKERSVPTLIKTYKGEEWLVTRILFNNIDKRDYIDIRIFERQNNNFKKTERGICLPLSVADKQIESILRFMAKYL